CFLLSAFCVSNMKAARRIPRKRRSPPSARQVRHPNAAAPRTHSRASALLQARLCELEMRLTQLESENHKLRDACRQLEAARASQSKLQDLAPVGLLTLDKQATILDINHTGAALLGWDKQHLLQRRFTFLVVTEDQEKFLGYLRRCRHGSSVLVAQRPGG